LGHDVPVWIPIQKGEMISKKWPVKWNLRTSQSHPITIGWISHDLLDGEI